MTLKAYLKEQNECWWKEDKNPTYPADPDLLLPRHLDELAERMASDLSPEALTCDGERRGAKLAARQKLLYAAKKELEDLGAVIPAY